MDKVTQWIELPHDDLHTIYQNLVGLSEKFADKTILITGASGFVGSWMLDSLLYFKKCSNLSMNICALTRDYSKLYDRYRNELCIVDGDIRNFPNGHSYDYILHFATHDGHRLDCLNNLDMFDIIANGSWHILDIAREVGCQIVLYMSSGVVNKNEDNPYVHGKRFGEYACNLYHKQYGMNIKIARGYDFIGPRLPLDKHFAIGNFIQDVLNGRPVKVNSDGLAVRSYLYMTDVVTWLWHILFNGQSCEPYNVGSDKIITIGNLARQVAEYDHNAGVFIKSLYSGVNDNYYPTENNVLRLGLKQTVSLDDALKRTIGWYKHVER